VKFGVRPSFYLMSSNSSAVILSCSAVLTVISINVGEDNFLESAKLTCTGRFDGAAIANILTIFPHRKYFVLPYFLFAFYLIVFCWCLLKAPFVKKAGLDNKLVLALFFCKIVAGIAIGWLSLHYYNSGNDYWDVNREGWNEYQLLRTNPHEYFTNLFRSDYPNGYAGLFDSFQSFWNDLRSNVIIKLVSIFNIFTGGNYYVNSLFFNFLVFFGHIALYRVFIKIYEDSSRFIIIGCFLLPSTLYFSSGIHKDGIVFLMLAMLLYTVFYALKEQRLGLKRILVLLFTLAILFLTRNFVCLALVPALIAWVLSARMKWSPLLVFIAVYVLAGILLFNYHNIFPGDPLETITKKQSDYLHLQHSSTDIQLDTLQPNFSSFVRQAPQAFNHTLLRPYLAELPSPILLPMNIELLLYQLLLLLFLFFRRKRGDGKTEPFIVFAVFFTLTMFLFIGYIVPNLGSLVRYRSLYLPLVITPLLCGIDWEKVRHIVKIKK